MVQNSIRVKVQVDGFGDVDFPLVLAIAEIPLEYNGATVYSSCRYIGVVAMRYFSDMHEDDLIYETTTRSIFDTFLTSENITDESRFPRIRDDAAFRAIYANLHDSLLNGIAKKGFMVD